jgi:hypothetical protein
MAPLLKQLSGISLTPRRKKTCQAVLKDCGVHVLALVIAVAYKLMPRQ